MDSTRYQRQILVKELGIKGQKNLATKHVILIGGGGLGSNSANILVRMGIGSIDIIDWDTIDVTNLHRTAVFTDRDVGKSKARILEKNLRLTNPNVQIKGIHTKVTSENIETFVENADVIVDGTDNIPLRHLINEVSIKHNIPWVYAGVYGTVGMVMAILPKKTACFQCITPNIPEAYTKETPVLGSLPVIIAAVQCNEIIKILLDERPSGLLIYDTWNQCFDKIDIRRNPHCQVCGNKDKRKKGKNP
jgi:molybdopterin/thiamine biosynthesis adenylyltransferase